MSERGTHAPLNVLSQLFILQLERRPLAQNQHRNEHPDSTKSMERCSSNREDMVVETSLELVDRPHMERCNSKSMDRQVIGSRGCGELVERTHTER